MTTTHLHRLPLITTLALMLSFAACSSDPADTEQAITPYSVTVRVPGATVADVTEALVTHIQNVDDSAAGLPGDWKVAGADALEPGQSPVDAALKLPGDTRLVEVCNHHYATQAMAFGGQHGVALPCEISITQDGDDVEVVMLNPEAIFGLFFHDIPAEHAAALSELAATVRGELEDLIVVGLSELDPEICLTDKGPAYRPEDLAAMTSMPRAIVMDREIPEAHRGSEADRETYRTAFVEALIVTLTHEGMETVGSQVPGLSVDDWRAARKAPLALPGGVQVVEMCSPTYAGAALSTGTYHAPALPCQVAVWLDGDHLRIHLLDPQFIFPVFFGDAPAEMMADMEGLVSSVSTDLQLIVASVEVD